MTNTEPKVGMGVTYGIGADYYPYTVVEVISPKKISVAPDETCGENEICTHTKDLSSWYTITLRKNGKWIPEGEKMREWGTYHLGYRANRRDPSF